MRHIEFREIEGRTAGFIVLIVLLAIVTLAGVLAGHHMEVEGHHVTGMNNRIVWGLPHVFAVFLIVAASGALNVASLSSVFGRAAYEPLARLSAVLAIALLAGGLAVLVLDLGRPDRLVVAMTHYNFSSIFAWNMLLYTGFMAVVVVYLWMHMERRMHRHVRRAGIVALVWRIVLTTGTGCIFGFLVARQAYDAAIMAPLFVAMSLSLGLAVFILVLLGAASATARSIDDALLAGSRACRRSSSRWCSTSCSPGTSPTSTWPSTPRSNGSCSSTAARIRRSSGSCRSLRAQLCRSPSCGGGVRSPGDGSQPRRRSWWWGG